MWEKRWEKVGRAGKWCEKVGKPHPNPGKICRSVPPFPTSVLSGSILEDASAAAKLAQTCDLSFFYILNSSFHVLLSNATTLAHPIALSNTFKPTPFRCSTPTCYRQNLLLPGHHPLILKDTLPFSQIIKALASTVAVFCTFGEARAG